MALQGLTREVSRLSAEQRLREEWSADFAALTWRTSAERAQRIGLIILLVDVLLFALVDWPTYAQGQWALNPAHERIFIWRCALVAWLALLCGYYMLSRISSRSHRVMTLNVVIGIPLFGAWFSSVCQTLISDVSIYAGALCASAALFPVPTRAKLVIYPVALASVLAGITWFTPDHSAVLVVYVNAVTSTIAALACEWICASAHRRHYVQDRLIEEERARSDALLRDLLPEPIVERLREGDHERLVEHHGAVSIVFADFVGFTRLSQQVPPQQLVETLDGLFREFDRAAERLGIEKIKTIGDAYMAACGAPLADQAHARKAAEMALAMLDIAQRYNQQAKLPVVVRIGLHTGPAIAGVIGRKRFCYDLWGDTVNTANRLETHGVPGKIHVSEAVFRQLQNDYELEPRGLVEIKGMGTMRTYFLQGHRSLH